MGGVARAHPRFRAAALCLLAALILLAVRARTGRAEPLSPVQQIESYPGARDIPIEQKVSLGSEAILDWQHQINLQYGQDIRPEKARSDHPLIPLIRRVLGDLPPPIHQLASRHTVAVYLLEEDFGTGTTEAVQDEAGKWRYAYIALNLTVLGRTANEWGTWKERSAFRDAPGVSLRMTLEPARTNTLEGAVRFILLHELGHVLGLALEAHGFWDAEALPEVTRRSPFVRISWQEGPEGPEGGMVSRWAEAFPIFSQLDFYSFEQATLSLNQAERAYRTLSQTDFPSLYGATNLFDDFAEVFAIYVHTRLLDKPYRVDIAMDGVHRFTYRSCVQEGRCPDKVRELERMLYEPFR